MFKTIILSAAILSIIYVAAKHIKDRCKQHSNTEGSTPAEGQEQSNSAPSQSGQPLTPAQIEKSLESFNSWISNCDQKAEILLAIYGVVITIFMTSDAVKLLYKFIFHPIVLCIENPQKFDFNESRFFILIAFLLTALCASGSLWYLLKTIKPNLKYEDIRKVNPEMVPKSYLFFMSVSGMKYVNYKSDPVNYNDDLSSQAYANATVATKKFQYYLEAIFYFKLMLLSSVVLFITVMFFN